MRYCLIFTLLSAFGLTIVFSQGTVWKKGSVLNTDLEYALSVCFSNEDRILFLNSNGPTFLELGGINIQMYDKMGCDIANYTITPANSNEILLPIELISTSDDGFILCGSVYIDEANYADLLILKLNSHFETEWMRHFGGYNLDEAWGIVEVSDGYIVAGDTYSYSDNVTNDGYIIKVDQEGNLVEELVHSTVEGEMNGYMDIISWSQDTILISGLEKYDEQGIVYDYYSVKKYDKDLVLLDSARYQIEELNTGGGRMHKTADGDLVLTCVRRYFDYVIDVWIAKVDSGLDWIFWEDYLDINYESDQCYAISELSNGDLILVGYTDPIAATNAWSYQPWVAKYSSVGDHIWTKKIDLLDSESNAQFWDVKVNSFDEIYIAGNNYTYDTIPGSGINYYNTDSWHIRMDTAGNIYKPLELIHNFMDDTIPVHQPHILPPYEAINGRPCYDYLWVVQDPDGLAISGPGEDNAFVPTKLGTYEFMLLVIDEEGSQVNATFNLFVTPATGMDDALPLQHIILIDHVIHHQCRVEISDKQIDRMVVYDINGRTVAHQAIEGRSEISLNAANWSAGVYHFAAYNQMGELIEVARAIKE